MVSCLRPVHLIPALALAGLCAHAEPIAEADMKAAFIFNFTVFTEWPADALPAGAPIQLCISNASPLWRAISQLNDKMVNGHRIAVRPAQAPLRQCHVLMVDSREHWSMWRRDIAGAPVLTVGEEQGNDGAIVGMGVDNRRLTFDVDMGAARLAHLNLSSKLLRLARSVQ